MMRIQVIDNWVITNTLLSERPFLPVLKFLLNSETGFTELKTIAGYMPDKILSKSIKANIMGKNHNS